MSSRALCILLVSSVLGGCALPEQGADFASDVPAERVNAAARAARDGDRSKARDLVSCLEASDPGLRMIASKALSDLNNGETYGYQYSVPASRQPEAMKRWREWADIQVTGSNGSGGVGGPASP